MDYLLTHRIRHWAEAAPERPAFRFAADELSYAALWRRSGQLARVLQEQGVRRGDRVGIHMHKCLQMPLAVYAILRAGAAFVPLDPNAPTARLRQMIRHCGLRLLISQPAKQAGINELLDAADADSGIDCVIGINAGSRTDTHFIGWDEVDSAPADPTDPGLMEQDLAYIMYTSGSTGIPKGIMHSHYSGLSYARMVAHCYGLGPTDRLGNHSPLHFDMSTLEYFGGPHAGSTTVLIPEPYTKLPASLSQLIEDERLSIWYSVPYALIQLLLRGVLEQRDLRSLRWVLFGGEPFPPKHLRQLMARWPQARFSNVYGPAEVNQCSYHHLPATGSMDRPPPIGRIWDNTEGLIVDQQDQPVADGDSGELLIRSPTMMRGYWQQPELNAKAFYHRPVTSDVSDRFYRSGDLVRRNADGLLEFIGRKDRQIKVRGYRVELDEVENVLSAHPQVVECGAYPLPADDDGLVIGATVLLDDSADTTSEQLRAFAAERLSAYAVPERISIHPSLPRTSSGKVDRHALQRMASEETP